MSAPRRSVLLLLAASSCWGASSAALANEGTDLAAGAPVIAGGGAATLCAVALLRRRGLLRALRAHPSLYARLGALEAINLALYVGALRVGPLPVMVALHLTAPVIIISSEVALQRRALSLLVCLELALVAGAIALVAVVAPGSTTSGNILVGSALALGSAFAVALLITQVSHEARTQDPDVAAALQLGLAAISTFPLVMATSPAATTAAWLFVVGIVLLGPGFALYWRALRGLDAPLAGILGLSEAVVASVLGALLFDAEVLRPATLSATVLILSAVALELRSGGRGLPQSLAGP